MLIKKLFLSFSILILFASVVSCASETSTEPKEGVINIAIETALGTKVVIERDLQLAVNIKINGEVSEDVEWRSADENIATVDTNGLVTGVALGTVSITVTSTADNSKTASVSIEVVLPPVVDILTGTISYTSGQSTFFGFEGTLAVDTTSLTTGTGTITYKDTTSTAIAGVSVDASTGKITVDSTVAIGTYTVDVMVSSSDGGSAMTSVTFDVIARYVVRISVMTNSSSIVYFEVTEIRGKMGVNEVIETSYELGSTNISEFAGLTHPFRYMFDNSLSLSGSLASGSTVSIIIRYPTAIDQIDIFLGAVVETSYTAENLQIEYSTDGGTTFTTKYGPQDTTATTANKIPIEGEEMTFSF